MIRRETEIKDLRAQLKKKQTTLKSLKTRLKNTQSDIEEIQRKVHVTMFRKMEDVDNLRMEIAELARQLKKVKGISRNDKEQLQMMADEISDPGMFGPGYAEFQEFKQQRETGNFNFDEYERAKMHDMFQHFQVKPAEKEMRDIRKVFLKLSQKFHPDLARNEKEAEDFHSLMQQINEAYQHNDIQTLLELESMYLLEELDFSTKAVTVDVLQQEIDRLKRDLHFIDQQIERTSEEIQNLRKSELGYMLTSFNKSERQGQGFDQANAHFDEMIRMFTALRDGLKESVEQGRFSPKLMDIIMGQEPGFDDGDDDFPPDVNPIDLVMRMMDGDQDAMDMFGDIFDDDFDDDYEPVENPKFPIGSSVRVKASIGMPYDKKIKMKGWEGRVMGAFYNEKEQVFYEVSFDSVTISQMPGKLIAEVVEEGEDFQEMEVMEHQLEACKPRDSEGDAVGAYRKAYHRHAWNFLENPAQAGRLQKILLHHPHLSDHENWTAHLLRHLKFPFDAKTRGLMDVKPGIAGQVLGFQQYDEEYGHIVVVKMKGEPGRQRYPLFDLRAADRRSPVSELLDDYSVWMEEILLI